MSHTVIITQSISPEGETAEPNHLQATRAGYTFEFAPSHDLSDKAVNQRMAKIRRTLQKLHEEVCAPETANGED